ncbi:4-hydroxyproline epimerase [Pseudovibrio axinellae]|uniref:4-hydroxyproline epimerase n=1 Tax=Pseudovibrio axinellae TaxID=989403 RepID=A0A165X814_9HYPH|nr:4-hydroxyproline epimerase [Pseudovibrio axinellae]KZL17439.1 4-hydroxyproline epimerase [Pseudovibrio axinellae]SER80123.1 proline racemase [Pseudovibrio axinellae]
MVSSKFFCVDGHTCGNPVRLIVGGAPTLHGSDMLEQRADFLKRYDWIRTGLMFEPRGHDMMSGAMLLPPTRPDCDVAVLFIETSGCLPMCGHGTIGVITLALEEGLITPREPGKVYLDTPAGLVVAEYFEKEGYIESVRLTNVPSYLAESGLSVDLPGLGKIRVDVAYGGNFYAIVEAQENFPGLENVGVAQLLEWSPRLRQALNDKYKIAHATDARIHGVSHIQWTGKPGSDTADWRNAVFYGEKALDRSPCGTGTSARLAQLYARGALKVGDTMRHESLIGSVFVGGIKEAAKLGDHDGIIPTIEGWARKTGDNTLLLDDRDPYMTGFQLTADGVVHFPDKASYRDLV